MSGIVKFIVIFFLPERVERSLAIERSEPGSCGQGIS